MADPWNTEVTGNGFTFKAGLSRNEYNKIFGFTLGNRGFLSIEAKNLADLVDLTERRSRQIDSKNKKASNLLTISVYPTGDIIKWIKKLKEPNSGISDLKIYVYTEPDKADSNFETVFTFYNVVQVGDPLSPKLFGIIPMPTALLYSFSYDSPVETGRNRG